MPVRIDGTDITGATIDGTDVTEITVDGDTVFSAAFFDGFEDGNINEYSGSTGSFTVTSSDTFEGSFALTGDGSFNGISRQDAMAPGETMELYGKGSFIQIFFGYDGTDGYMVQFANGEKIQFYYVDNNILNSIGFDNTGNWDETVYFQCVIRYNSPTLEGEVFDLSGNSKHSFSVSDGRHTNTGFGFRASLALYDSVTIS